MAPPTWRGSGQAPNLLEAISKFFTNTSTSEDPATFTKPVYFAFFGCFTAIIFFSLFIAIMYGFEDKKIKDGMENAYQEHVRLAVARIVQRKKYQEKMSKLNPAVSLINQFEVDWPLRKHIRSKRNSMSEVDFWNSAIPFIGLSHTAKKGSRSKSFGLFRDVERSYHQKHYEETALARERIRQVLYYLSRKDRDNDYERFRWQTLARQRTEKLHPRNSCGPFSIDSRISACKRGQLEIPPYQKSKTHTNFAWLCPMSGTSPRPVTVYQGKKRMTIDRVRTYGRESSKRVALVPALEERTFVGLVPERKPGLAIVEHPVFEDSDSDSDSDIDGKECLLNKFA